MNNPNNLVKAQQLENLATTTRAYTLGELSAALAGINDFTGATSAVAGSNGLVPAPSAGDNSKFLRGDGTWAMFTIGSTPSTVEGAFWLEDD